METRQFGPLLNLFPPSHVEVSPAFVLPPISMPRAPSGHACRRSPSLPSPRPPPLPARMVVETPFLALLRLKSSHRRPVESRFLVSHSQWPCSHEGLLHLRPCAASAVHYRPPPHCKKNSTESRSSLTNEPQPPRRSPYRIGPRSTDPPS